MNRRARGGAPWPYEVHGYLMRPPPPRRLPGGDLPQTRRLRVYTQDPSIGRLDGAVTTLLIPNEPLEPGPAGAWFVIEDIDEDSDTAAPQSRLDLDAPAWLMRDGLDPSTTDRRYACQMTYAVAMEVYARYMRALGRNPGFGPIPHADGRLRIRPRAFREANAYYARDEGVLKFGWDRAGEFAGSAGHVGAPTRTQPGAAVYLALSRDIIAHEVSHALLDGLRPNFMRPTHADVLALHEGFSDLVAVFLHFAQRDVVAAALERTQGEVEDDRLAAIGRQFGYELIDGRRPLRTALHSAVIDDAPVPAPYRYDEAKAEHALGAVLVSAVFEAFRRVYARKTAKLRRVFAPYQGRMPVEAIDLLAGEACALAEQFLNIVIRAIDYCPSHHCTFGEYLRAMITADADLVPDDPWAYREALVSAFRRYGIPVPDVPDLSEQALLWDRAPNLVVPELRFANLRLAADDGLIGWADDREALAAAADALARSVCRTEHGEQFGLAAPGPRIDPPRLMSLRTLRRVSPDGSVRFGLVAELVQRRRVAEGWFYGGSTLVIDSDGRLRYVVYKHIDSERRLKTQRAWLATQPAHVRAAAWADSSGDSTALLRRIHAERAPA